MRDLDAWHGVDTLKTWSFDQRKIINSLSVEQRKWLCGAWFRRQASLPRITWPPEPWSENTFAWLFQRMLRTLYMQERPLEMFVDSMLRQRCLSSTWTCVHLVQELSVLSTSLSLSLEEEMATSSKSTSMVKILEWHRKHSSMEQSMDSHQALMGSKVWWPQTRATYIEWKTTISARCFFAKTTPCQ